MPKHRGAFTLSEQRNAQTVQPDRDTLIQKSIEMGFINFGIRVRVFHEGFSFSPTDGGDSMKSNKVDKTVPEASVNILWSLV